MATFRKLPSGKINVQIRKNGFSASKTFITKRAAMAWARDIEIEHEQGSLDSNDGQDVAWLLEKYVREISPGKRSYKTEKQNIELMIKDIGTVKLADITPSVIQKYIVSLSANNKPSTIKRKLATLSHAFNVGHRLWGINAKNPVEQAKRALETTDILKVDNARIRRVTDAEYKLIEESRWSDIFMFAIETALRRGEILNIDKERDLKGRLLNIPKTKNGEARQIPLSKKAIEILDRLDNIPFDFHPSSITHFMMKFCKKNGIKDLRFHDLRHEAISRLFEKGLQIHEVALISGHKDWRMLKRYTHLKAESLIDRLG